MLLLLFSYRAYSSLFPENNTVSLSLNMKFKASKLKRINRRKVNQYVNVISYRYQRVSYSYREALSIYFYFNR